MVGVRLSIIKVLVTTSEVLKSTEPSYYNANKKKLRNKVSSELEGFRRSK